MIEQMRLMGYVRQCFQGSFVIAFTSLFRCRKSQMAFLTVFIVVTSHLRAGSVSAFRY